MIIPAKEMCYVYPRYKVCFHKNFKIYHYQNTNILALLECYNTPFSSSIKTNPPKKLLLQSPVALGKSGNAGNVEK